MAIKKIYVDQNYIIKEDPSLAIGLLEYPKKSTHYTERSGEFRVIDEANKTDFKITIAGAPSWQDDSTTAVNATGTIAVTNLSAAVVGTGTLFTSECDTGDTIRIAGVDYIISTITDDLNLTLTIVYAGGTAGGIVPEIYRTFYTEVSLRAFFRTNTAT